MFADLLLVGEKVFLVQSHVVGGKMDVLHRPEIPVGEFLVEVLVDRLDGEGFLNSVQRVETAATDLPDKGAVSICGGVDKVGVAAEVGKIRFGALVDLGDEAEAEGAIWTTENEDARIVFTTHFQEITCGVELCLTRAALGQVIF